MDPAVAKLRDVPLPDAELTAIDYFAGRAIASIRIYPVRYSPRAKALTYLTKATLKISFEQTKANPQPLRPSAMAAGTDLKKLIALVDNPRDIEIKIHTVADFPTIQPITPVHIPSKWPSSRTQAPPSATFPIYRNGIAWIPPGIILTPLPEDWPYVIITDNYEWNEDGTKGNQIGNLISEFETLARWKTTRARMPFMVNAFGDHWHAGTTRDVQEAVRNFLKFAYQNWNTRWCLVGGDVNIVPARHVLGNISWFCIEKDSNASPNAGEMYLDSSTPALRYQATYDLTTADVFVSVSSVSAIPYNDSAKTTDPGWYWTESDYTTHSTIPTRYIVLRGNATLLNEDFTIPHYINMIPNDLYYGTIGYHPVSATLFSHDWDLDANGIYGWWDNGNPDGVNFTADASVGRAPVRTTDQAHAFVEKVLTYERYQDIRTDKPLSFDYVRKLYCVADTWGSGWSDGSFDKLRSSNLDGACQDKENVIMQFRTLGLPTDLIKRIYADIFFVPQIESDLSVLDQAHVPQQRAAVNEGPHFLSVTGHGWWDGTAGFSSTNSSWVNVESMTNWPHLAIYYVDSCLTNEFDADIWTDYDRTGDHQVDPNAVCFGKHLVRWNQGGAIGYVGCARECVVGDGPSIELPFWHALTSLPKPRLGTMLDHARSIGIGAVGAYEVHLLNLMGDPELPVWTDVPRTFTVSHCSNIYGQDKLTVTVFFEEQPFTDASVCVSQMSDTDPLDKTYFPLLSADEGNYTFDTSGAKDGHVYVVVTSQNFIPYVGMAEKASTPISPYKFRTKGFVYGLAARPGASLFAGSGDNTLYALSSNLTLQWKRVLNGPVQSVEAAPDGTVYVNSSGNPGMSTPGMGDALSGIIGALMGQGMAPLDALALGVFIHGDAADRVAKRIGPIGYLTGDVIEELPRAIGALMS
jgi:hypothetical protein